MTRRCNLGCAHCYSSSTRARGGDEVHAIYFGDGQGVSCASCHGSKGDGRGRMAKLFDPPPRNFLCAQTMAAIDDGQIFWIVRNGSPGTSMPPHTHLNDERTWQVVLYLRSLKP